MLPLSAHPIVMNAALAARLSRQRISIEAGLYIARHGDDRIYFCRAKRYDRYRKGVLRLIERLADDYHLTRTGFRGGTLIDCGANVGELGLWAHRNGHAYIAFEPETLKADCCDRNNFRGEARTHRLALWNTRCILKLHMKPDTADSSVFEIAGATGTRDIQADRLDEILKADTLARPIILKIEAEGAEPEVLQGAEGLLDAVDFVAIDCGYERGREKAHTFVEANEILVRHGLTPIAANFKRVTMLYGRVASRTST
jgi:FkbM family methyltransferase